jgi:hypothetical protein
MQVEVAEQRGTDVDGQSVVGEVGGEQPSEVVRGKPDVGQLRVLVGEAGAEPGQHVAKSAGVMTSVRWPMVRWNRNGCGSLVTCSCLS